MFVTKQTERTPNICGVLTMALTAVDTEYRIIVAPHDLEGEAFIDHGQKVIWIARDLGRTRFAQVVRQASRQAREELAGRS